MARPKDSKRVARALPRLPPTVKPQAIPGGREWRFRRLFAHVLAAPALLAAVLFGWHALGLAQLPGPPPKQALLQAHALASLLLAAALHLGTLHWRVRVDDSGVCIDRSSWLWPRVHQLPKSALLGLQHRLSYTVTTGSGESRERAVEYHSIFVAVGGGKTLKLSPGLPGPASASAMIRHLQEAAAAPPAASADLPGASALGPGRWHLITWGGWLAVVLAGWGLLLIA